MRERLPMMQPSFYLYQLVQVLYRLGVVDDFLFINGVEGLYFFELEKDRER
jgi:hypothetical protein